MKSSHLTIAMLAISLFGAAPNNAEACMAAIEVKELFVINAPGKEVLEAATEDRILLTLSTPVVPNAISHSVTLESESPVLRLVSKLNANRSGLVGAQLVEYTFEVVGDGEADIVIETHNSKGKLIDRKVQRVEALYRRVYRGCK